MLTRGTAGPYGTFNLFLIFWGTIILFLHSGCWPFTLALELHRCPTISAPSAGLVLSQEPCWWGGVESHCGLNLQISDDSWRWTSFMRSLVIHIFSLEQSSTSLLISKLHCFLLSSAIHFFGVCFFLNSWVVHKFPTRGLFGFYVHSIQKETFKTGQLGHTASSLQSIEIKWQMLVDVPD